MRIDSVSATVLDAGLLKSALFRRPQASPMAHFPEYRADRSWFWPPEKVVTVVRAGGLEGVSVTSGGAVVASIVERHFARLLTGRDCGDIETLWELMFRSIVPFDRSGFAMMAIAGVDLALWDLAAAASGRSTVDLLGGQRHDKLPVYATTSSPETVAADPRFGGLKIPLPGVPGDGEEGIRANAAALSRARQSIGPDRDLMVDAFLGWDASFAERMVEVLADFGVLWLEDPLLPTDLDGYRRLARKAEGRVKLALGNFCFSRWDCEPLIENGLVSALQPDVAWAGGLTESRRIVALAERHGIPVILHNGAEQPWALALSAASPSIQSVEWVDRDPGSLLNDLFETGPEMRDGAVLLKPEAFRHGLSARARAALVKREAPVSQAMSEVAANG